MIFEDLIERGNWIKVGEIVVGFKGKFVCRNDKILAWVIEGENLFFRKKTRMEIMGFWVIYYLFI